MVWNLFPFKGDFSFGKSQKMQGIWDVRGPSHLGDLMLCQNTLHEMWCISGHGRDEAANHQLPIAATFWIIWSFCREIFKLNAKFYSDSLFSLLSHFECNGHTVHMVNQWHLLPPLTSTVTLSLFTHVHSSPLSLAAMIHWCHANCSHYINNSWTFFRQTSSCTSMGTWYFKKSHWSKNSR